MSIFERVLRAGEGRKLRRVSEIVPLIDEWEPELETLSGDELARKTLEFRERLENGETLDDLLVEAFAVVREASKRTIGQRHYEVQLMGGIALHFGWIAEMRTGEGKTLVSTLPVYLNALEGNGVHVVTVNDYLAQRDSEWMGQIYRSLGITFGRVTPDITDPALKRAAYAADVTYGTNTEFGFDYLRDNMARSLPERVQRGFNYAIVDEVDSILIDEARTPLIISGPAEVSQEVYYRFSGLVRTLKPEADYDVDEEKRTVLLTQDGIERVERALGIENLFDLSAITELHQVNQALRAKELYHRDKDYIVERGEVKIVDEFTGRTLEGRRWSEGLHQAVEAKERVKIREENHTWATVTLQNYFRLYDKLAGMTGTAETEANEFMNTYSLQVVPIPTHRPAQRNDQSDLIYKTEMAKFNAVVADIEERHEKGQPILVGTASVAKSELLSRLLTQKGIVHSVLNAKLHSLEAQIVAQAGRVGAVTVATNMAGRGVDILLGGNPEGLAMQDVVAQGLDPSSEDGQARFADLLEKYRETCRAEGERVRELGGLYVLGSERHESRRIDNQLRGRSGRQGDPGESRFYLSLEDDLLRLFAGGTLNWVMQRTFPDDLPIEAKMVNRAIERAQSTVEGKNAEIRKEVLKYDEVLNQQRKVIYDLRLAVLEGDDLFDRTLEILDEVLLTEIDTYCEREFQEEWDLEGLVGAIRMIWPTKFEVSDLEEASTKEQLFESLRAEAVEHYEEKEQRLPGGSEMARDIEREVMLTVIDQKWREHLADMDYLREGINLRAMGQQDPLVAWQREGFAMFTDMMSAIDADYLRYVMQVEVVQATPEGVDFEQASYSAATDPGDLSLIGGFNPVPLETLMGGLETPSAETSASPGFDPMSESQAPLVKDENTKLGRNDPCWCGSGSKYKFCHGRTN
jgi:preprotein translocase subunit SecA